MSFAFVPEYAWQVWAAAAIVVVAAAGLAIAWRVRVDRRPRAHLGGSPRTQMAVSAATGAAAVLLAIALSGPTLFRRGDPETFHVVVLLDVSDSMVRAPGGVAAVRRLASERLRKALGSRGGDATAQVMTFRSDAVAFGPIAPLARIADRVDALADSAFAVGPGTNIANGLIQAGAAIDRTGGRGAVLLVSDGNETDGDARAASAQLAARGIAVHVLPVAGGPATLGIVAANLSTQVDAGSETFVRGVIGNAGRGRADATVELAQQALDGAQPGDPRTTRRAVQMAGGQSAQFRTPVFFDKPGLQFVDVAVGAGGASERRRLFTHVERSPRVLAIGDDRWTGAFPSGAIDVVRREPAAAATGEPIENFDAVVIDSVPAAAFPAGALARVARAVQARTTGLFVMNGRHTGTALDATNLMSYDDTPLEPLLPLVSQARARQAGPPPRHVVMLVDTSGSMCGAPLATAQQIALFIVDRFLRAEDLLDLMAFTTSASARLTEEPMTPQGKARASDEIRRMACDGGTDPREALQKLAARRLKNCGLLFFSDGGFGPLQQLSQYRPDCRTTVFGIRPDPFRADEPMSALADPIHVDAAFDPSRVKIPYFDPDAKNHFFEPGAYTALSMKHVLPSGFAVEIPAIPLAGSATTSPKDDVVPMAVRPKLTDPVLAYREAATANVGELTTTLPAEWLARADGRAAIRQWIEAVLPAVNNRRYTFQVAQHGAEVELEIALAPEGDRLPDVDRIEASLELPGTPGVDVAMRRDDSSPATFRGRLTLPALDRATPGTLVLKESGAGALVRPQRIAMLVPPRQELAARRGPESLTFGLNDALLRDVAAEGGGSYDALERLAGERRAASGRTIDLWPIAAALGCAFYLAAILVRRVDG